MRGVTRFWVPALIVASAAWACAYRSEAPASVQTMPVGRTSRSYVAEGRPRWDGAGPRPLAVLIWYPAEPGTVEEDWFIGRPTDPLFRLGRSADGARPALSQGKRALVVLSHGTGGSAAMLAWLGEALARAGYLVAAVNHHGNTSAEASPTPEGFTLWWERATDLSQVADRLMQDPQFGASVDATRIGAAGFSLGGYSVLAVAGARTSLAQWEAFCESAMRDSTCAAQPEFPEARTEFAKIRDRPDVQASLGRHGESFRDPRFRAVFAMAPVGSWLTEGSLREIEVPVRIIVGTHDATAPAATNARRVAELVPDAQLSVLDRVGHYTFLAECGTSGIEGTASLCREESGIDRADVHRRVAAEAVEFFGSILGIR